MSWKSYGVVLGGSTLLSLCCILTIQLYDVIESIHFCWTMEMFYHVRLGRVTEVNMSTNMRKRQWVIARRAIMKRRRRRDAESLWRELMRWGMLTWSFLVWYMFLATFFVASSNNWSFCFCILTNQCPCQHCGGIDWLAVVQSDYCFKEIHPNWQERKDKKDEKKTLDLVCSIYFAFNPDSS